MNEDTQKRIGTVLDGSAQRDAIHIAVVPLVAGCELLPGSKFTLKFGTSDTAVVPSSDNEALGLIDPFLPHVIQPGQRFYGFLFPNSVTGMRHHWQHPEFPDNGAVRLSQDEKINAEIWLKAYAARHSPYDDAETAFANLVDGLKRGEIFYHGEDLHGLYELEEPEELRRHAETYLGIRIDWNNFSFNCSC